MNHIEEAVRLFEEGFTCSQAILAAFAPVFDLDRETALRIAEPFGGGMGHQGEACGALAGAMMVIGLAHGRTQADDEEAEENTYGRVSILRERFRDRAGSLLCRDLLGADYAVPGQVENLPDVERERLHGVCTGAVRTAAEIVEEIL